MCLSCGLFVPAVPREETLEPVPDSCPDCGEAEFADPESTRRVETH